MSINNILRTISTHNKPLKAEEIVAVKAKKLEDIFEPHIQSYLYKRLHNVYLNSINLFEILDVCYTAGKCYYLSAGSIHGMEPNDLLVNGNLLPDHPTGYAHQWVEFCFNDKWYVLDDCLPELFDWHVLGYTLPKVYDREKYYSLFKPAINFKKSKDELMKDDFVVKHGELLRNPEWSTDDKLFFYYKGERIEECKKRLYENIEIDENGHIISYNNPDIQKGHLK